MCIYVILIHIYIYIYTVRLCISREGGFFTGPAACPVDFRNFIVFLLGRDPGTLKSDIASKKHPQLICSDVRLSN